MSDDFTPLWPGGPLFREAAHFRLSTDSVLLADFIRPDSARRGIDLGCGSGILSLLLLARTEKLEMTGLELLPDAAALANENFAQNAFSPRAQAICGDLRRCRELFPAGAFDLAAANPPYYPVAAGAHSPEPERAAARSELMCTLEDLCSAAAWLVRSGGSFSLVYKPERLSELLCCLSSHDLEPKRLRLVCDRAESAPSLVLVESRRGGRPGLRIEPGLILHGTDGAPSAEQRRIYHRD